MTKTIPPNSLAAAVDFPTNPFVGLRPFESQEAYLFFGRNEQSVELMKKLHQYRFIGVVGSSGCGKSSLIRAGLIPKLEAGFLIGERDRWLIAKLRPGDAPFARLAEALIVCAGPQAKPDGAGSWPSSAQIQKLAAEIQLAELSAVVGYLKPVLEAAQANLLLLVDQFEEIINFGLKSEDPAQREAATEFVSLMLGLAEQRALPIYVVMTMRSDFLGECDNFHGLPEALNRSQYLVPRLTRRQRQQAIEGPVRLYGGQTTPRLLDRVLNDAGDQADQLPVMQHALMRTWEKWRQSGDAAVDLPHYEAAGTMNAALSNDAEKALSTLTTQEQEIAKRMFQALTATDQSNRRTSHPLHFNQLLAVTGGNPTQLTQIIESFRAEGRSFLIKDNSADPLISISHESLIRQWATLEKWIQEELNSVDVYTRLADAAARYEKNPARGRLWRDPELEAALTWRAARQPNEAWAKRYHPAFGAAMLLLDKSREEREHERREAERQRQLEEELKVTKVREEKLRRRQLVIPVIFGLFLLSLASSVYAFMQRSEADKQREFAVLKREEAISQGVLARASELKAKEETGRAEREEQRAKEQSEKAENAAQEAQEQRTLAEKLAAKARGLAAEEGKLKEQARREAEKNRERVYVANVNLAQSALEEANHARAAQLLDESSQRQQAQADLRSFAWYSLWLRKQKTAELKGHAGRVWAVAHAQVDFPSRRLVQEGGWEILATAHEDKAVILWDAISNQRLATLKGGKFDHTDEVYAVAFSHDGTRLVTAGADKKVKVWDVRALLPGRRETPSPQNANQPREPLLDGDAHTHNVYAATFAPGAKDLLASGGHDGKVFLWDLKTKQRQPLNHEKSVWAVAFSPDGKLLVSAGDEGLVKLWDVNTKQLQKTLEKHDEVVTVVKFSPDGRLLATASDDETVRLWTVGTWEYKRLPGHKGGVRSVVFSPDGKRLVTAGNDNIVQLWSVSSGQKLETLEGSEPGVNGLSFLSDSRLATAGNNGIIRLWNIDARPIVKTVAAHADAVREVAFSPDNKWLASGSNDKDVRIWDAQTWQLKATLKGHTAAVASVYFSPDGKTLASASEDGSVKLWNWESGREKTTLKGDGQGMISVTFSPNGEKLAAGDGAGRVRLWDALSGNALGTLVGPQVEVSCIQFSPNEGKWLAAAGTDGTVWVWEVESRRVSRKIEAHNGLTYTVSFSPDGEFLASSGDGEVKVWDLLDEKAAPVVLTGHAFTRAAAMFAPGNDHTLAARGNDGALKLWDTRTWKELLTLRGPSADYNYLAFAPDGKKIATADSSGTITVWFAATDAEVKAARNKDVKSPR